MTTATARRQFVAPTQWEGALAQYRTATDLYRRYQRDVYDPAHHRERDFEKRHGLDNAAPGYIERRRSLQAAHDYQKPLSIEEAADRLCDEMVQAEGHLMRIPAPDLAALLMKLEKLLAVENGSTDSWSGDYVRQTIEDMRRLLA